MRRDLTFAAAHLPESDAPGRVTKWSALGMLAKLHLTMASDLNDANSDDNFAKAKDFAGQVITQSGLTLMQKYEDLFKVENNNNPESLFAIQCSQVSAKDGVATRASPSTSSTTWSITLRMAPAYLRRTNGENGS